ncbi:MAG TPA: DUF4178 domain-containing protein, partial [Sphingomonas sp.]|nr:DUF4178 domain-containing protein [Sphingomonas sp.]
LGDDLYDAFFANSVAQVDYVVGEFYWRVRVGEEVKAADWVRPGWMLSRESNAHEVSWTLLELLEPRAVERAFGASPSGSWWPPMPHQPSPHSAWLKQGLKVAIGAVAALILLMFLFGNSRWGEVGSFPIASDGATRSVTLGPVELTGSYQHIDIRAEVPVLNNGWVDLDYALVNRATQKAYEAYAAAERYSGRDSDGDWNEGSRRASVSIASVPAGTYDLVLEYKGNRWSSTSTTPAADEGWMAAYNEPRVIVEIRQGALYGSNLVLAMILIAIPLVIGLVRHIHFDQARRAESDFGG